MQPVVIEVHLLDIPEVQAAIAAGVEAGIRAATRPIPQEWLTKREYAELLGLSLKTLYNQLWRLPPTEEGPTRAKCIRRAVAEEWIALPETEQRRRWGKRLMAQRAG
jgi:hypothetical protein